MRYFCFDENSFRLDVEKALETVNRILEVQRNPRLAESVDHKYDNKYDLANLMTNVGIIAQTNCLGPLGLTSTVLKGLEKAKATTLRFEASETCTFLKEDEVEVPMERTVETVEDTETASSSFIGSTTKATISRVVNRVKEYHWQVHVKWEISVYSGTDVDQKTVLQSRDTSTIVVVQATKTPPLPEHREDSPLEVSLTWFLQQIDTKEMVSQFKIDTLSIDTKTPLRNKQVEEALDFMNMLSRWAMEVRDYFCETLEHEILRKHNPAGGPPTSQKFWDLESWHAADIFNPVQPLMEDKKKDSEPLDVLGGGPASASQQKSVLRLVNVVGGGDEERTSPLFSIGDMTKVINEHIRSMEDRMQTIQKSFSAKDLAEPISEVEATLVVLCDHMQRLCNTYSNSMGYIEWMLEQQLVAAIGKRVDSADLDKFVRFHNAKLLDPPPKPFCHSIRRPNHYPDGVLSIEGHTTGPSNDKKEPIDTFVREVHTSKSLRVPLSAASTLELTGKTFLHGWLRHRFQHTSERYELIARARQFSSFMLVVGTMTGSNELDPKDAIILQNKDEVVIPLLLNELPSAKEFKDAIQSLSPEQQRFAKSFRSMQLESSVLGVCIIQIKPQLEKLLGLPPDALTKEMKLTQDLMELFIEYQVPSDLLSYDGETEDASIREKVENVKTHAKAVLDVVDGAKAKQLDEQTKKAEMAVNQAVADRPQDFFSSFGGGGMQQMQQLAYAAPPNVMAKSGLKLSGSTVSRSRPVGVAQKSRTRTVVASTTVARNADSSSAPPPKQMAAPPPPTTAPQAASRTQPGDPQHGLEEDPAKEKLSYRKGKDTAPSEDVDFTMVPKMLDGMIEEYDKDSSLRSTTVKTVDAWTRLRQENLLSKLCRHRLAANDIKSEKNKAFDLLDALSRSGSLPIACSELHVIICLTHRFENDVMGTVIQDNVNPIEKLEMSALLFASAINGVAAKELIRDPQELNRLSGFFPLLLE